MGGLLQDINISCNFQAVLRERGKLVKGSVREGHNVFTTTGRNWLSRLIAWRSIGPTDSPYTNRRVRWLGLGIGTQLETPNVFSMQTPIAIFTNSYLAPIQAVEFPTSTSVRFIREFSYNDITFTSTPVVLTEAALYADVNPVSLNTGRDGSDDVAQIPGVVNTTLNPALGNNPPIAYKSFEGLTKTVDFILEIRWDFRFE